MNREISFHRIGWQPEDKDRGVTERDGGTEGLAVLFKGLAA